MKISEKKNQSQTPIYKDLQLVFNPVKTTEKYIMETAGVEPASKHIATQKTTLIVRSFEIRLVKRRETGFLRC